MQFNYSNSQHMGGGQLPHDFQRLADLFWGIFDQAIRQFNLDQNTINVLADSINNPQTIMASLDAVIVDGQYNTQQLFQDISIFIQNELRKYQQMRPPQNAFGQTSAFPTPQQNVVFSNTRGGFPMSGPVGQAQNFGRGPQMMPTSPQQTTSTTLSSMASKLKGQPKIKPQQQQQQTNPQQKPQPVKPKVYVVTETAPPVEQTPVDIGVPDDEFVKTHITIKAKYKGQIGAPALLSHISLNYPNSTKMPMIRFLYQNYPQFFAAEKWVVTVDTEVLHVNKVDSSKGEIITEAFNRMAEKSKIVTDYNSFAGEFLSSLKTLGDDLFIDKLLWAQFKKFIATYLRSPEDAMVFPLLTKWADIAELYKSSSAWMRPWAQANPMYHTNLNNIILSTLNNVFPGGNTPILDAFKQKNRGITASIPTLQLVHGKYALRDHAIADKAALESFALQLKSSYIIRKEPLRMILTNIPEDEVVSDTAITVVPVSQSGENHMVSLMHYANLNLTTLDTVDIASGNVYHLNQILGCEGDDPTVNSWSTHVGQNVQLDMVYFDLE